MPGQLDFQALSDRRTVNFIVSCIEIKFDVFHFGIICYLRNRYDLVYGDIFDFRGCEDTQPSLHIPIDTCHLRFSISRTFSKFS